MRVRPLADASELDGFIRCRDLAFGHAYDPASVSGFAKVAELDRTVVAEEASEIVGTGAAYSFRVSVPGGSDLPSAALKALSTRPTHRRRGVLRNVLSALLTDAATRGDALSILWASEAGIYPRFGYGLSADLLHWELPARARFNGALGNMTAAPLRLIDNAGPIGDTVAVVAPIYERARHARPGMPGRSDAWWDRMVEMRRFDRCTFVVVGEEAYAAYSVEGHWGETGPANRVVVREAVVASPAAEPALWRFLLDLDLAGSIVAYGRPPDEGLVVLLEDVRAMRRRLSDGLFVRIVDIAAALTGRTYAADGRVTFSVEDPLLPANTGTWALAVDGGRATCRRSRAGADLAVAVPELSAAVLGGGAGFARLAGAGLIDERRAGAAATADRLFAWPVAPWGVTYY